MTSTRLERARSASSRFCSSISSDPDPQPLGGHALADRHGAQALHVGHTSKSRIRSMILSASSISSKATSRNRFAKRR